MSTNKVAAIVSESHPLYAVNQRSDRKALGLTIPPSLLARADQIIE